MAYRGPLHEFNGFNLNFMLHGRELFVPIDVMMGQMEGMAGEDELHYVYGLREKLQDTYNMAMKHLRHGAVQQEEVL